MYMLMVILISLSGDETVMPVTNVKHETVLNCHVEKSQYRNDELVKFQCAFVDGKSIKFVK